jgi:hypothetical protein
MIGLFNSSIFLKITICTFILIILMYLWFKIITLENDISILNHKFKQQFSVVPNKPISEKKINPEKINKEDFIMKEIFNCCDNNGVCSVKIPKQESNTFFDKKNAEIIIEPSSAIDDLGSITLSSLDDKNTPKPNNKKQLQKLNLESLREKCGDLELSAEGTKAELIDRILQHNE